MKAMAGLMFSARPSQSMCSMPSSWCSAALTRPKSFENSELNMMAMATVEVM